MDWIDVVLKWGLLIPVVVFNIIAIGFLIYGIVELFKDDQNLIEKIYNRQNILETKVQNLEMAFMRHSHNVEVLESFRKRMEKKYDTV